MSETRSYVPGTIELEEGAAREARAADAPIPIAISSTEPYERQTGPSGSRYLEILDHSEAAIDLSRAARGLPFLYEHNPHELLGRVDNLRLSGGKLRGLLRFGKSPRAEEVKRDVLDGIRTDISVGYQQITARKDPSPPGYQGLPRLVVTRWMPVEVSSVSVPADSTVGVGRSAAPIPPRTVEITRHMPEQAELPQQTREKEISDILDLSKLHGIDSQLSHEWIRGGATVDQVRRHILDEVHARKPLPINATTGAPAFFGNDREKRRYSIVRLLDASINKGVDAGFEREVSQDIARQMGRSSQGVWVPYEALVPQKRSLTTGTATKGPEVVWTDAGEFIPMLRNKSRVAQLGARPLPGLQGNVAFPRQASSAGATWVAEAPGSGLAASDLTLDQVTMVPKQLQSVALFSRLLAIQSAPSVETMVQDDITASHGLAIDLAAINGSGASNEPTGILNTAGIGSVPIGTNGGAPTYEHLVDLEAQIENANADAAGMGYLSTPGIKAKLKKTQKFAGTNGESVWLGGQEGELNGYRAFGSKQVPSTLTKGSSTDCHAIIFGDFSQCLIGMWGVGFELLIDPYSFANRNLIQVVSYQAVNIAFRRAVSFAAIKDARTV